MTDAGETRTLEPARRLPARMLSSAVAPSDALGLKTLLALGCGVLAVYPLATTLLGAPASRPPVVAAVFIAAGAASTSYSSW
jgi:hypothetical protein